MSGLALLTRICMMFTGCSRSK